MFLWKETSPNSQGTVDTRRAKMMSSELAVAGEFSCHEGGSGPGGGSMGRLAWPSGLLGPGGELTGRGHQCELAKTETGSPPYWLMRTKMFEVPTFSMAGH